MGRPGISQETALAILRILASGRAQNATQVAAALDRNAKNTAIRLRILVPAGLLAIRPRREGNRYFEITAKGRAFLLKPDEQLFAPEKSEGNKVTAGDPQTWGRLADPRCEFGCNGDGYTTDFARDARVPCDCTRRDANGRRPAPALSASMADPFEAVVSAFSRSAA